MAWVYTYGGVTDYTDGTSTQSWQPDSFAYGGRITFSEAGDVDQLSAYCAAIDGTRTVKIALYDTSGNVVLDGGETAGFSATSQAWREPSAVTAASVSATDYIILSSASTNKVAYGWDSANDGSTSTDDYADFVVDPAVGFSLETESGNGYGRRANFTASGGGSGPNLLTLLGVG